ncbi:MAG: cytochrome c biogenesis protein CcsA [Myxococcales bacterium]|nr:cytochrome c biogenesis protein CcsA [Myxococcales bacterium]
MTTVQTNWVALFGSFVLLCTLILTTYAGGAAVAGARRQSQPLIRSSIYAGYACTALLSLASALIFFSVLSNDFSLKYVQQNSDAAMPWFYKLTSYWGGLDGSMMFWAWLLSIFSTVAISRNRERHRELIPWVSAILMGIQAFFVSLVVFYKRPFDTFLSEAPAAGKGLNPLLQDFYMATHPPSLYVGYVSASVPFAFCMAALITGNLDDSWLQSVRRWMLVCWYFLSQGLILGSLWAYHVLGWGGYWGWDPVENAGILPWFTATAFLHSLMIQERRGMMKVWNVVLVVLTFLLTMVGTFMTRSGIVQSVHAFGNDPELAARFLAFIGFASVFSFGYLMYRLPLLRSRADMESVLSREFAFLLNNWVLIACAFFILVATLFPTLSEAVTRNRVTVGPPFFNRWMAPLGLILLLLTGIGPLLAWRRASPGMMWKQLRYPVIVAVMTIVLVGSMLPWARATSSFMHERIQLPVSLLCFGLCAMVLITVGQEFVVGTRARQHGTKLDFLTALVGLLLRNKRRYGGYLVHVGIVLMFFGFAGQTFQVENEVTLARGKSTKIGRYDVTLSSFRSTSDPQKEVTEARLLVKIDGQSPFELRPAKWAYRGHEEEPPRTIVATHNRLFEDLYVILNGIDDNESVAGLKLIINPLVLWVWLGFVMLMVGTATALLPDRSDGKGSEPTEPESRASGSVKKAATAVVALLLLFGASSSYAATGGDQAMHQSTEGQNFPTPPRNELERDLRKTIVCMCGCGRQTLSECTCGFAAKERGIIARLIDEGRSREQIIRHFLDKYPGESALVVPQDVGFNRLAWIFPVVIISAALAALGFLARRWSHQARLSAASTKTSNEADRASYERRLDDDLDDMD